MRYYKIQPIFLGIVSTWIMCPNLVNGLNFETKNSSNIPNVTNTANLLGDDSKLLDRNYTPDQINEIIYHLNRENQNLDFSKSGHARDISILIDFFCSNEFVENVVEAYDIVTELPLDD